MKYYLQAMLDHLSEDDSAMLKAIYAPRVVAVQPTDASRNLCVAPDGEIRLYGCIDKKEPDDPGTPVYMSSRDCGLSWKTHLIHSDKYLGAAGYNPETGRYINAYPNEYRKPTQQAFKEPGTWAVLSDRGFDDEDCRFVFLTDKHVHILKKPLYIEECRRWFIPGEWNTPDRHKHVVIFTSDDDGENWNMQMLSHAPAFEPKPPHKNTRWQQYSCEPTIVSLGGDRLMMIVRTSQDYHYMHYSDDRGDSWTDPAPSPFHGTITMPVLEKLSDGRIVFFWCNNQPMPERDPDTIFPPLDATARAGIWEDVFTNRDANHLAITEDCGKSWRGFRELFLNEIRNYADFRSIGGANSRDKSVHQAEILELPYNKLLVSFGQNQIARKVVILDIDWLYETDRREDFRLGLGNVTTHMYLHSNLCGYKGFSGHCAYNRTNGALLIPDPAGNFEEVLQICRIEDERLVYKKQGAVWNYPATTRGKVSVRFMIRGSGIAVSLTDHWYNACDETVRDGVFCSLSVTAQDTAPDVWHDMDIRYDTDMGTAAVYLDGVLWRNLTAAVPAPMGLCYLHLQTLAEDEDQAGTLIKTLSKTAE